MSITWIYRVRIDSNFMQEFEDKFSSDAMHKIQEAAGFISASILKLTKWSPNEYAMVSQWDNEELLKTYFGEKWNEAAIISNSCCTACTRLLRNLKYILTPSGYNFHLK